MAIRPYFRTQAFFRRWMWAWSAHAANLALCSWLMGVERGSSPARSLGLFISAILGILFVPLLIAGAEAFRKSGYDHKVARAGALVALLGSLFIYGGSILVGSDSLPGFKVLTISREFAASGALGYCAYVFFCDWRRIARSGSFLAMLSCGSYGLTRMLHALLVAGGAASNVRWISIDILCQGGIAIATLLLILEQQANAVSAALEELKISEQRYQFEASHDGLVRLWNQKAILDLLANELSRAQRLRVPVSVFLIDLDLFKQVNDTYGHLVGDDVLRSVAAKITNAVREYDHVGRYGGEEFLVVLPECTAEAAKQIAERVRESISREPVLCSPSEVSITASFGVSQWRPEQQIRELLQEVDVALYEAKHNGRNRIVVGNMREENGDKPAASQATARQFFAGCAPPPRSHLV